MVGYSGDYYKEERNIKLTQSEIDLIIDELERTAHNIYTFLKYSDLIKKLRKTK